MHICKQPGFDKRFNICFGCEPDTVVEHVCRTSCHPARRTCRVADAIRDRAKAGESVPELAEDYGLSPVVIERILREPTA